MSVDQTQQVIDHYFEVMVAGGDFSQSYADEISCIMLDANVEIRGPIAVRDYMIALHAQMSETHTRSIVVSDGAAYLEGDCPDPEKGEPHRIAYCAAYDITGDRITAMRCYGSLGSVTTRINPAST
jgi:hypothetical protein